MADPRSGKDGNVLIGATPVTELTNWKLSSKSNNPAYASNNTSGHKKRKAGVKDRGGSLSCLDTPTFNEGDSVTLILKLDGSTTYKTVPAIIDSIDVDVDLDEGSIIGYSVSFSGNGAPS